MDNSQFTLTFVALLLGLTAWSPINLVAQTEQLEEVVVKGKSIEGELTSEQGQLGNQLEIISSEDIEKSGQNDVQQVLRKLVPGMFVSPDYGNRMTGGDPALQGGNDGSLVWLIDGVRVSGRLFSTFLPFMPPQYVKRIEILKGGQGLFYGTQAIDGVINIVTKDGTDLNMGEASVALGTIGDGDERNFHALMNNQSEDLNVVVFGSQNAGSIQPFRDQDYDTTALRRLRRWNVGSVGLKATKNLTGDDLIKVNLLRNEIEYDRPQPEGHFKRTNIRTQDVWSLKYEKHFSQRSAFYVKTYWHDWDTEWTSLSVNDTGVIEVGSNSERWWFEDYGFNGMGTYEFSDGSEIIGGVDMQKIEGADFVINTLQKTETVWAGFAQYRPVLSFSPETKLSLGGRYNVADLGDNSFVWNLSGRQPLAMGTYFRVSGGKSFRNPNIVELFEVNRDSSFCSVPGVSAPCDKLGAAVAGIDLEPEESLGFNIGFGGLHQWNQMPVNWEVGYFDRSIQNLIQNADLDGSGDTITPKNVDGESTRQGIETELGFQFSQEWKLNMNASFVEAINAGDTQQADLVPESVYKAFLRFDDDGGRWGTQLTGVYTGKIYQTIDANAGGRQNFGEYGTLDLAGYYNLDVAGRKKLSFRLENVFDADEAQRIGDATDPNTGAVRKVERVVPERNLMVKYTQKF